MNKIDKNYFGLIKSEVKRMFSLKYMIITICTSILILSMGAIMYSKQYGRFSELEFYYMFTTIFTGGFFYELILIPIGLYILVNLCTDINQKMVYMLASRASVETYIIAKIIAGLLFSFTVSFLSVGGFVLLFSSNMPMIYDFPTNVDLYTTLLENNLIGYFIIRVYFISLAATLFTLIAMVITAIIPNSYVAAMSSFFSFAIVDKLIFLMRLPSEVNITSIIAGLVTVGNSMSQTVFYVTFFFLTSMLLVAILFYKIMRWRCYGESV